MSKTFLETIKILDGEIFHISYHQKRYENTLSKFNILKTDQLKDFLNPPKDGLYRCRVVYDLDGNLDLTDDNTDDDPYADFVDSDDDNDGTLTIDEDLEPDSDLTEDRDGDGDPTNDIGDGDPTNDDTDGDGVPNYLDTDNSESRDD